MSYRYFLVMQFNGKNYHGWQIQPNSHTVQAEVNEKLGIILGMPITTIGAGRTDTGVHARYFTAHFDSHVNLDSRLTTICYRLNHFFSDDINVQKIVKVPDNAHARFDAVSRTYKYYISIAKDVFNKEFSWQVLYNLDIDIMNEGAKILMEYNDFTSFCKLHSYVKTKYCHITSAFWIREGHQLILTITADRFLRNMVRAIVGTLVQLGRNKINLVQLRKIIEAKNRSSAGESVPAHGLFLYNIEYPYAL
jgi:tRNA pseudouridine38-40 synthase